MDEPSSTDPKPDVMAVHDDVVELMREALDLAEAEGFAGRATGAWELCGLEPAPGLAYDARGVVSGGDGTPLERVQRLADALVDAGWEGGEVRSEPVPHAQLTRRGQSLNLGVSERDSSRLTLSIRTRCLESTQELDDELGGVEETIAPQQG